MAPSLKKHTVEQWMANALAYFHSSDLIGIPEPWQKIYAVLTDYLAENKSVDRKLFWMISNTKDSKSDVVFQLQRLKRFLSKAAIEEKALQELELLSDWFDRAIIQVIEKENDNKPFRSILEEPYEAIFRNARDGIYITTPEGRFINANQTLLKMLGLERMEDLVNKAVGQTLFDSPKAFENTLNRLLSEGGFDAQIAYLRHASGKRITVEESWYMLPAPNGEHCFVGTFRDITSDQFKRETERDHQKARETNVLEAAIAANRAAKRTDALMEVNDHPVVLVDSISLALIDCNTAFMRRMHYGKKQITALSLRDLFDETSWTTLFNRLAASMGRQHFHVRDLTLKCFKEATFIADCSVLVRQDEDLPLLYLQFEERTEVNQLKTLLSQSRFNLKQTMDTAQEGFVLFRANGTITYINQYLKELLGYSQRRLLDVKFFSGLFVNQQDGPTFMQQISEFIRGDHTHKQKVTLNRRHGEPLVMAMTTATIKLEGKGRPGFLALLSPPRRLINNVTETVDDLARLEKDNNRLVQDMKKLAKSFDAAQQAEKFKLSFIDHLLSKFKVPIHVVTGYTSLLAKFAQDQLNVSQQKDLAIIEERLEILMGMLAKATEFARLEKGEVVVRLESRGVRDMLDELFRDLRPEEPLQDVEFNANHAILSRDWRIEIDLALLESLLGHLLANAIAFTNEGQISLTAIEENDFLEIELIDTGTGIAACDQPNIFEPFFQGNLGGNPNKEHLGLGLTIARHYAALLGIKMHMESKLGQGTSIRLAIPGKAH